MGDLDGLETTERIRSDSVLNKNTPVIALTANVSDDCMESCRQAGMAGFIEKPLNLQTLHQSVELADN